MLNTQWVPTYLDFLFLFIMNKFIMNLQILQNTGD